MLFRDVCPSILYLGEKSKRQHMEKVFFFFFFLNSFTFSLINHNLTQQTSLIVFRFHHIWCWSSVYRHFVIVVCTKKLGWLKCHLGTGSHCFLNIFFLFKSCTFHLLLTFSLSTASRRDETYDDIRLITKHYLSCN